MTAAEVTAARPGPPVADLYLAGIMIVNSMLSVVPLELFLLEVWPTHGWSSLLLFVLPLAVGCAIAWALPERYFRVTAIEASGRIYEYIGIRFFKRFAPSGDYVNRAMRRTDPRYRLVRDTESAVAFEPRTRLAERCHIVSVVFAVPCVIYALMLGWTNFALWFALPTIPLHLYPILLQRYTRARIQYVVARRRSPDRFA